METNLSPNFDVRPDGAEIDMLVLHYTGMETGEAALERLCDSAAKVSAHYLIHENGDVVQMVEEVNRAWHAGVASWRGESDVNARSIGIELVNPGHEFGYREFPDAQLTALEGLCLDILSRHSIPARNVVGHSDVAPTRKQDPGELFPWQQLAAKKIGIWPRRLGSISSSTDHVAALFLLYGYDVENLPLAIGAFQRHFRPERVDGVADGETLGLLRGLIHLIN
ncbi:MAG: N-acetylmuramoyl-L-alanine amidase [Rhodospirillaceae bacterium]|jgi:N-acetylmuramoyl-L-alanine amidase|nr:N-acetylmuramoyl-L-alanine amidase [Rhodospirillales bacterium]MBT3908005.1 N-acetylmuramoyl-L-alanine amidase [Rhodospirillaceae bacterium]MBT4702195.1 N-acetylmuramoyl-L-alanine amidase [Rhodospirillaceae bacterium]MBT5036636.1 N-acetylmuramoyl-L-alanine amidase [Rhodospirillaceae bacterium]MBT6220866.1 N-acetylmuramoyl-L-alanine amidase [Rhodospirillaceae bacterium]